jgi:hypothetical protein
MRLLAGMGLALLCAGCASLPDGVKVDLEQGMIEVGPCRCKLPPASQPEAAGVRPG